MLVLPNCSGSIRDRGPGAARVAGPGRRSRACPKIRGRAPIHGKKTPEVIHRIEAIMNTRRRRPDECLKWTRRTTARSPPNSGPRHPGRCQNGRRTAAEDGLLAARQPRELSGSAHPDRDAQFSQITELRERCAAKCLPIISVDTKRRNSSAPQESGRQIGSRARARQRPRLPLRRRRHRRFPMGYTTCRPTVAPCSSAPLIKPRVRR